MQVDATPLEMLAPTVVPRVKQLRNLIRFRIYARQVRTFVQVAVHAGEGQVVEVIRAAMTFGTDVFEVEGGQGRILLVKLAILAPVAGSLPNFRSIRRVHRLTTPENSLGEPDVGEWR